MQQLTFSQRNPMQFRHPESYRILSDDRILQDPMGSGVGYVDLGTLDFLAGRFFTFISNKIDSYIFIKQKSCCYNHLS